MPKRNDIKMNGSHLEMNGSHLEMNGTHLEMNGSHLEINGILSLYCLTIEEWKIL